MSTAPVRAAPQAVSSSTSPGQRFSDVLLLGALACQAPAAVLSVPQADGRWSTLSHGFDHRTGLNDPTLYEAIAANDGRVEFFDLATSLPKSPLVQPPHAMRWAYGAALHDGEGRIIGVVAVMDRWVRRLTRREQFALVALARQLSWMLVLAAPLGRSKRGGAEDPAAGAALSERQRALNAPNPAVDMARRLPSLLRSHEVAGLFNVTERTVINWAHAGKLQTVRTIGGHLRFSRDDVMRMLSDGNGTSS